MEVHKTKKNYLSKENIPVCKPGFRVRLHSGKFSSEKNISFVLNSLVVHESLQHKEKLSVQKSFP